MWVGLQPRKKKEGIIKPKEKGNLLCWVFAILCPLLNGVHGWRLIYSLLHMDFVLVGKADVYTWRINI